MLYGAGSYSEDFDTGCPKLPIVHSFGVLFCKRVYDSHEMYLLNEMRQSLLIQCQGIYFGNEKNSIISLIMTL